MGEGRKGGVWYVTRREFVKTVFGGVAIALGLVLLPWVMGVICG